MVEFFFFFFLDKALGSIFITNLEKYVYDFWYVSCGWKWDSLKDLLSNELLFNLASTSIFPNSTLKDTLI